MSGFGKGCCRTWSFCKGTKISYRAGDQPNNALSLNVLNPGEIATTAGTSGVVYGVSGEIKYDPYSRVNTFAHVNHSTEANPVWAFYFCINGTGILNSWLNKNLGNKAFSYEEMNQKASEVAIGSEGLSILPFGNGAERVLRNKNIGAQISGLGFNTHTGGPARRAARVNSAPRQASRAVMGGTQSLHTNGFDEAIGLPTERAAKLALRTQQVIGHESGAADTVDPLAGSYFVEALTDQVEAEAWQYIDKIDGMGGSVAAIEAGYMQDEIEQAAYAYTKAIDDREKVIVGVNKFVDDEPEPVEVFPIDPELQRNQADRVRTLKAERPSPTRCRARRSRGRGARHAEPARAHEGGAPSPGDPRRGQRRAARRLRRVPALTLRLSTVIT